MPNWCCNDIWLRGSKEDLDDYVQKYTTDGAMDLNKIAPMPKEYLDDDRCYIWRLEHWGTKWNITSDSIWNRIDDEMIVSTVETAWLPPLKGLKKLSELCPNLEIEIIYDESGCAFQGNCIFKNGKGTEVYYRQGDDYIDEFENDEPEPDKCPVCGESMFFRMVDIDGTNLVEQKFCLSCDT